MSFQSVIKNSVKEALEIGGTQVDIANNIIRSISENFMIAQTTIKLTPEMTEPFGEEHSKNRIYDNFINSVDVKKCVSEYFGEPVNFIDYRDGTKECSFKLIAFIEKKEK